MILEHNNNSGKLLGEGGRAAGKESGECVQEEMVGCGGKDGLCWRDGEEDLIYLRGVGGPADFTRGLALTSAF